MKIDYIQLAEKYQTPLYVYDGNKIEEKYKTFKSAFDVKNFKIHYAVKALSNISILQLLRKLGAGLDCVSINEVHLGLKAGYLPEDIIFTPNGVGFEEYKTAIKLGVHITVENISILEKLGQYYQDTPIFIRLNPHLTAGGNSKIRVGQIDSKFGISIHQIPIVQRIVKKYKINVEGLHIHTGSDIIDTDIFHRVATLIFSIADDFENIKSIDFGSGFKVKYKDNDLETDIKAVGKRFSKDFNAYCKKRKKDLILRFEPGKYLVSEAGSFLSKVNVVKQTTACTFAGMDTGFNHLIRPMFYNAFHEIENISNLKGEKKMYSIVGYICESDTFAEDRVLNNVRENDILRFKNAGAYCFTMSSNFNSRLRPPEVLCYNGKDYLIRQREDFDYLLHNQLKPDIEGLD